MSHVQATYTMRKQATKPKTLEIFFENATEWSRIFCQVARHVDGVPMHAKTATGVIPGTRLQIDLRPGLPIDLTTGRVFIEIEQERVSLATAKQYVGQLQAIEKGIAKLGTPQNFGEQVTRFAQVTGCTRFWIWRPSRPVFETSDPEAASLEINAEIRAQYDFLKLWAKRQKETNE